MYALVLLLLAFTALVVLIRFKVHIGLAFTICAIVLSTAYMKTPYAALDAVVGGLVNLGTWRLAGLVILILIYSYSLKSSGLLDRMIRDFVNLVPDRRFPAVAMPAMIGLLPMPGGAILTAPAVEEATEKTKTTPELKVAANYWFRHIWEYSWPLYPGLLLGATMGSDFGISIGEIVIYQAPLTLVTIAAGIFFIYRRMDKGEPVKRVSTPFLARLASFVMHALSILFIIAVVILVTAFGNRIMSAVGATARVFSITVSGSNEALATTKDVILMVTLVFMIFAILLRFRDRVGEFKKLILADKSIVSMVFMVIGVMIFKEVFSLENTHGIAIGDSVALTLEGSRIPAPLVATIVPFILGLVTGFVPAFVGCCMVLILSVADSTMNGAVLSAFVFAYIGGYLGVILSPTHLCFVLTARYFKTDILSVYRHILPPAITVFITGLVLASIYLFLGL